jgi:hypothetical protein
MQVSVTPAYGRFVLVQRERLTVDFRDARAEAKAVVRERLRRVRTRASERVGALPVGHERLVIARETFGDGG